MRKKLDWYFVKRIDYLLGKSDLTVYFSVFKAKPCVSFLKKLRKFILPPCQPEFWCQAAFGYKPALRSSIFTLSDPLFMY